MQSGEALLFNNRRVLHGRTPIAGGAARWLRGRYIELDIVKSRRRMLRAAPQTQRKSKEGLEEERVGSLPLPLPPAGAGDSQPRVQVGGDAVPLDALGPVVVNKDGSLSRITNWGSMTELEQEQTKRIIGKRNADRRKALE